MRNASTLLIVTSIFLALPFYAEAADGCMFHAKKDYSHSLKEIHELEKEEDIETQEARDREQAAYIGYLAKIQICEELAPVKIEAAPEAQKAQDDFLNF